MTIEQFNTLHRTYQPEFRSLALALTHDADRAQDLLQEVVYQVLKHRDSFQPGTDFAAWVKRIIKNVFISGYRRSKRRADIITAKGVPANWCGNGTVTNSGENRLQEEEVNLLIAQLPERYRYTFLLYFHGLSYHEIARRSHVPIGTVKSRIFKARALLRDQLRKREGTSAL